MRFDLFFSKYYALQYATLMDACEDFFFFKQAEGTYVLDIRSWELT